MASTKGLIQLIKLNYDLETVWVYIGPTTTDIQLFFLNFNNNDIGGFGNNDREAVFLKSMLDQLVSSMLAQREVTVYHADDNSNIYAVEISAAGG